MSNPFLQPLERRMLFSTYVISPAGSNSNPGTLDAPWQTLAYALSTAPAGSTLELRAGTYAGNVKIEAPNLTIESYLGEQAIIAAADSSQVNLDVDLSASGLNLINLDIGGGIYCVKTESTYDTGARNPFGVGNLLIQGCRIHDSADHLIKISPGSDHVTISHSELFDSGRVDPNAGQGIDNVNGSFMTLEDSYIHDIAQDGVFVKGGSTGSVIQRNKFVNMGYGAILLGQDAGYAYFNRAVNPQLYESIDCTARNNIIINAGYAGIGVWASLRPHVYNNTIINAAQKGQGGIYITGFGHADAPNHSQFTQNSGVQIINNIVVQSSGSPVVHLTANADADPPFFAHNRYYQMGGTASFLDETSGFSGDLAQWQAYSNSDSGSTEGDPMLDAFARPLAGSPVIGAGMALADVPDDFSGNPRPSAGLDIGAVQSGAGSVSATPQTPVVQSLSVVDPITGQPLAGYQLIVNRELLRIPRGTLLDIRANVSGAQVVQFALRITRRRILRSMSAVDAAGGADDILKFHAGRYVLTVIPLLDPSSAASAGTPVVLIFRLAFYRPHIPRVIRTSLPKLRPTMPRTSFHS